MTADLLRLRNGEDFIAKVSVNRLANNALRDRLKKYGTVGVSWYVGFMRAMMDAGSDLPVLLRNAETSKVIQHRTAERMFEEEQAPAALKEKLPLLPGTTAKTKR